MVLFLSQAVVHSGDSGLSLAGLISRYFCGSSIGLGLSGISGLVEYLSEWSGVVHGARAGVLEPVHGDGGFGLGVMRSLRPLVELVL